MAWDYIGKKHVDVGARRWVCEWYTWHPDSDPDAPDRDPIEDTECHSRAFPTRRFAESYGRRHAECWEVWNPVVYEETFAIEHDGDPTWSQTFGVWEMVGEREDVEDAPPLGVWWKEA